MNFLFVLIVGISFVNSEDKYINVKGKLLCGEQPAFNVLLRLWPMHEEKGYDILAENYTTQDGSFSIQGRVFTNRNYVNLKVYHDCADGLKIAALLNISRHFFQAGQRKFIFYIPTKYSADIKNLKPYDFGELNLETRFKHNEEREEEVTRKRKRKDLSLKTTTDWTNKYESPEERQDPW